MFLLIPVFIIAGVSLVTAVIISRMKYKISTKILSSSSKRLAIILNHKQFKIKDTEVRRGTDADVKSLVAHLPDFGFGCIVFDNLSFDEIMHLGQWVEKYKEINLTNMDSILIIVLSHGTQNEISAKDKTYQLTKLIDQFHPKKLIKMKDKPKLFFLATCRGNARQTFHEISGAQNYQTDSGQSGKLGHCPLYNDLVIFYATTLNNISFRESKNGTIFIQKLMLVIKEIKTNLEISDIFQNMNKYLIQSSQDLRQIAEMANTLSKPYYFKKNK